MGWGSAFHTRPPLSLTAQAGGLSGRPLFEMSTEVGGSVEGWRGSVGGVRGGVGGGGGTICRLLPVGGSPESHLGRLDMRPLPHMAALMMAPRSGCLPPPPLPTHPWRSACHPPHPHPAAGSASGVRADPGAGAAGGRGRGGQRGRRLRQDSGGWVHRVGGWGVGAGQCGGAARVWGGCLHLVAACRCGTERCHGKPVLRPAITPTLPSLVPPLALCPTVLTVPCCAVLPAAPLPRRRQPRRALHCLCLRRSPPGAPGQAGARGLAAP